MKIQESLICRYYKEGHSLRATGQAFTIHHTTVLDILRKNDIPRRAWNPPRSLSEMQEEEIGRLYLDGATGPQLANQFKVSAKTVYKALSENDIKVRPFGNSYIVRNDHFFDTIDTESKAYWYGFIAADGCILQDRRTLVILLAHKDKKHLAVFRDTISATHPVMDVKSHSFYARIRVHNPPLIGGLIKNGLCPNKTHKLRWPIHFQSNMLNHFIRGYVDGDGGFYVTPNKHRKAPNISFNVTSFEGFIESLQNHLMQICNLSKTKFSRRRKGIKSPTLRYCGRLQVKRIFDYLYKDATIWLPRKREKIEPYL